RGPDGQDGVLGMPRWDPAACRTGCDACVMACPTEAIVGADGKVTVDYGRCIVCQRCVEDCPEGAMTSSYDWAFGVRRREDLLWKEALDSRPGQDLGKRGAR
ncbi:4Fe-4S binding protein, partial [Acidithiobacillus sp. MC6.1]|nr:4Fe-4S binding protein [Acidithiobacillus sp. MC6.1]